MRSTLQSIIIALACFCFFACKNSTHKHADYSSIKGRLPVSFSGSGHAWHFERMINYRLQEVQHYDYDDGKLISLQYAQDKLMALNYKDSKIIFFNNELQHQSEFGRKGKGVSMNTGIMNFDYLEGHIFLYDFGSRAIKYYETAKNLLMYASKIEHPTGVYRVGHLKDARYIYVQPRDSLKDMAFVFSDTSSRQQLPAYSLDSLLQLNHKVDYPGMAYDGNFVSEPLSRYLVYYCSFAGLFFCFDKETNAFVFHTSTIDHTPAPKAMYVPIAPGHESLEIEPDIMFFPSASVSGNRLYIMNSIDAGKDCMADIYDLDNRGAYKGSFFIPYSDDDRAQSIAVNGNQLYVLYNNQKITRYAIHTN